MKRLEQLLSEEELQDNSEEILEELKGNRKFNIKMLIASIGLCAVVVMGIAGTTAGVVVHNQTEKVRTTVTGEVKQLMAQNNQIPDDEKDRLVARVLEKTKESMSTGGDVYVDSQISQDTVDAIVNGVKEELYNEYSSYISENDFNDIVNQITLDITRNAQSNEELSSIINSISSDYEKEIFDLRAELGKDKGNLENESNQRQKDIDSLDGRTDKAEDDILSNRQLINELDGKLAQSSQDLASKLNGSSNDLSNELNTAKESLTQVINDNNTNMTRVVEENKNEITTNLNNYIQSNNEDLTQIKSDIQTNSLSIGQKSSLVTNNKGSLVDAVNEVFTLVSDGKSSIASTLTDKGIATAQDATFETINDNIRSLYTKAFADGAASVTTPNPDIDYEYHHHTDAYGNRTNASVLSTAGGCYTKAKYHVHVSGCYQTKHGILTCVGNNHYFRLSCNRCGHIFGDAGNNIPEAEDGEGYAAMIWAQSGIKTNYGDTKTVYMEHYCTYVENTCGKTESTFEGYAPACGRNYGEIVSATIHFGESGNTTNSASTQSIAPTSQRMSLGSVMSD